MDVPPPPDLRHGARERQLDDIDRAARAERTPLDRIIDAAHKRSIITILARRRRRHQK